jgi:hypothetical protein
MKIQLTNIAAISFIIAIITFFITGFNINAFVGIWFFSIFVGVVLNIIYILFKFVCNFFE